MRALIVFLLFTGMAMAQPARPFFPWWESRFADDVDLDEQQRRRIREIQRQYRDKMIDQRAALEKAEARLEDLFAAREIDESAARAAVDELIAARSAITRSLTEMSIELRRLLTLEQWQELQEKRMERRELLWRGGPSRRGRPPRGGDAAPPPPHVPDPHEDRPF